MPEDSVPECLDEDGAEKHDALIGCLLDGKFRIESELGRGGMAVVYRAYQSDMDRHVAIKLPLPGNVLDRSSLHRFTREAQVLSRMHHPSLAAVHAAGATPDGRPFIAMEILEGRSLDHWLSHPSIEHRMRCLPRFIEIAEGLAHAHENGIVHRDLKPSNVVVMKGPQGEQAKVLDFGVAKNLGATPEQKATATGSIVGSPLYMSPEQFSGREVDARCDVYSFGCLLYELVAGRPPFVTESVFALMDAHCNHDPPPIDYSPPYETLARKLHLIALKAMRKDPQSRFANLSEVAELLRAVEQDPTISLGFASPVRISKPGRTIPQSVPIVLAMLVAAIGIGIVAFTSVNKNATEAAKFEADSATMRLARGLSLSNSGQLEEAEMELRRALLLPMRPETRFDTQHKLADVLYATRNNAKRLEALRIYKELIVSLEAAAPDPAKRVKRVADVLDDLHERVAEVAMDLSLPLPEAEEYARKAYDLYVQRGQSKGDFNVMRYMAAIERRKGNFVKAAEWGDKTLDGLNMHVPPEGNTCEIAAEVATDFRKAGRGTPAQIKATIVERLQNVAASEDWRPRLNANLDRVLHLEGK